jgi:ATP-binding cassette, subfamily B, bacterial PglK
MKSPLGQVGNVIRLLGPADRRKLMLVFAGSVFMAVLGVVGVGSIMPFIAVASNPEIIQRNIYLSWAYTTLGFRSESGFLIFLGISVLGFLVLSN